MEEVDKSMRLHNIKTGISFRNMDNKPMRHIHTAKRQKKKEMEKKNEFHTNRKLCYNQINAPSNQPS